MEDDYAVNVKNLYLYGSLHLRLSHLFPRQPDGQSQTSGPTHLPPFIHMGSHTPAKRVRERNCRLASMSSSHVVRLKEQIRQQKKRKNDFGRSSQGGERLTFLATPPGVSLQTGADAVPHTQTAVLAGRTANSWKIEKCMNVCMTD